MKKLMVIAVLALCLTGMVSTVASGGGGNAVVGATPRGTLVYQMSPGDQISDSRNLYGLWQQGYKDVFFMINMGPDAGIWKIEIKDDGLMGDTMFAIKIGEGGFEWNWATSPEYMYFDVAHMEPGSWVIVITGYIDAPGGFPAGYYYDIWM